MCIRDRNSSDSSNDRSFNLGWSLATKAVAEAYSRSGRTLGGIDCNTIYIPGLFYCSSIFLCVDGTVSFFVDASLRDVTPCVE